MFMAAGLVLVLPSPPASAVCGHCVRGGLTFTWGGAGDVPLPLPDVIRRFFFPPL